MDRYSVKLALGCFFHPGCSAVVQCQLRQLLRSVSRSFQSILRVVHIIMQHEAVGRSNFYIFLLSPFRFHLVLSRLVTFRPCKGNGSDTCFYGPDARSADELCNLGSGSWWAWTNDTPTPIHEMWGSAVTSRSGSGRRNRRVGYCQTSNISSLFSVNLYTQSARSALITVSLQ